MGWSQEVVEALMALAAQGYSASICASHFEGMSRNAAVGLAHRRGFQFFGNSGGKGGGAATIPKEQRCKPNAHYTRKPKPTIVEDAPIVELPRMATLDELKFNDCRYMFGMPDDPSHRYCGAEGFPYCPSHRALCYKPSTKGEPVLARNQSEQELVDALVTRYVTGDLSEDVFKASLRRYLNNDDIRFLTMINQLAHRNSLAFRRGEVA